VVGSLFPRGPANVSKRHGAIPGRTSANAKKEQPPDGQRLEHSGPQSP
jgi:hypothetical protein